jgi:hypothetical protein
MWECHDFIVAMVGGLQNGLKTFVTSSARVKHVLPNSLDVCVGITAAT